MRYIQLAFQGKNNFLSYVATIALTVSTILGLGLVPYNVGLNRKGIPLDKIGSTPPAEAIDLLGKNAYLTFNLFPFIIGLLALIVSIKIVHRRPIKTLFTSREKFDWKRFFTSFIAWGTLMFIMLGISVWIFDAPVTWNFNPATFLMLLIISVFLIPLQTTLEEAFFRGYLIQGTGTVFRRGWISVLFTSILFGLLHMGNPEVKLLGQGILGYYIITGIFLGLITIMDDGLELSIGFHAINNIFGALILTNNWQVFQSDALWMDASPPSFDWSNIASLAICYPLLLFFFARNYRWKTWKEKLFGKIHNPKPTGTDTDLEHEK